MADIDLTPAPAVDIAPPEPTAPAVPDFVEFTGVESGYELAPAEPLPLDVAPEPEIIDGDWRVIDEPAPLEVAPAWEPGAMPGWGLAPIYPDPGPRWQPVPAASSSPTTAPDSRSAPWCRPECRANPLPRTAGRMMAAAPQRAAGGFPLWSPFRLDGWLTGFLSWFSLDWLAGPPSHYSRQRAAVDYLAYQVEAEHGGPVHYFLNNIKRIRLATETYTDEGLYIFTIPIYLKGQMERAIQELGKVGIVVERID